MHGRFADIQFVYPEVFPVQVLLAGMLFGEVRGCLNRETQIAVGCVPFSRHTNPIHMFRGKTVSELIIQPWQFSCFWEKNKNSERTLHYILNTYKDFLAGRTSGNVLYCLADDIVKDSVLRETGKSLTDSATHYADSRLKDMDRVFPPSDFRKTAQMENITFFVELTPAKTTK